MKTLTKEQKIKALEDALELLISFHHSFTCIACTDALCKVQGRYIPMELQQEVFPEFATYINFVGKRLKDNYYPFCAWRLEYGNMEYVVSREFRVNLLTRWIKHIKRTGDFNVNVRILQLNKEIKQRKESI